MKGNLTHDGNEVIIEITDTGVGIDSRDIPRIFDPFFTTQEVGKGTGLGLSVSYSLIRKHGGALEVQSEQGRGTTFNVKLPVNQRSFSREIM